MKTKEEETRLKNRRGFGLNMKSYFALSCKIKIKIGNIYVLLELGKNILKRTISPKSLKPCYFIVL